MFWQVAGLTDLGLPSQCCPDLPDAGAEKVGDLEELEGGFGETLSEGFVEKTEDGFEEEMTCDFGDIARQVASEIKHCSFQFNFQAFQVDKMKVTGDTTEANKKVAEKSDDISCGNMSDEDSQSTLEGSPESKAKEDHSVQEEHSKIGLVLEKFDHVGFSLGEQTFFY